MRVKPQNLQNKPKILFKRGARSWIGLCCLPSDYIKMLQLWNYLQIFL